MQDDDSLGPGEEGTTGFDAKLLSSRKLLELAVVPEQTDPSALCREAIAELAKRGHYLTELSDRGLISIR